jgi:hypothetical protein
MNSQAKCFTKESDLVTRRIADETIIVPVRAHVAQLDCVYTLNEVGGLIWELIDGQTPLGQIAAAICGTYEVTPEEAAKDLNEFLTGLEAAGLIRLASGGET